MNIPKNKTANTHQLRSALVSLQKEVDNRELIALKSFVTICGPSLVVGKADKGVATFRISDAVKGSNKFGTLMGTLDTTLRDLGTFSIQTIRKADGIHVQTVIPVVKCIQGLSLIEGDDTLNQQEILELLKTEKP